MDRQIHKFNSNDYVDKIEATEEITQEYPEVLVTYNLMVNKIEEIDNLKI